MILIPIHPQHTKNQESHSEEDGTPCAICGKGVKIPKWWVRIHNGGNHFVTDEEASKLPDNADCGWFPVGPTCYKKHPEIHEYAYPEQQEPTESKMTFDDWSALYIHYWVMPEKASDRSSYEYYSCLVEYYNQKMFPTREEAKSWDREYKPLAQRYRADNFPSST